MRILMLIHRLLDNSPYCFYVHEQAKALRALGHEVVVVAPVGTLPGQRFLRPAAWRVARATPAQAKPDGVPVHYPRYAALSNAGERALGGLAMAVGVWPTIRRLHKKAPFDVLHAHMLPQEGHAGVLLGRRLCIPVALTVHGTDVLRNFPPAGQGRPTRRNARIAREADALLAVSSLLANRVRPYREGPVEIVPNGVDLSLLCEDVPRVPRSILCVGTLKKRKCIAETLEAFISIKDDYPDATLTIVGVGEMEEALRARIAQAGLEGRACLTGGLAHAQVMERMAQSDVFCLPSYGEGYGIVYIEAMASGAVAIGARGEGIEDMIRPGVNGLLVDAGDVRQIRDAITSVFDHKQGLGTLRERARRDARALTWARNAEHMTQVYARIINAKKEGGKA